MTRVWIQVGIAALALATSSPRTMADGAKEIEEGKPWTRGVSAQAQASARALFETANAQFEANKHTDALRLYQQALAHWDHPRIRINAAVSLVELDRFLDASEHIEAARKHREDLAERDRAVLDRVSGEIDANTGIVEVESRQKGAVITVDGDEVLVGPGTVSRRVAPGKHQLVARRDGLEPYSQKLDVAAGERQRVTPVLFLVETEWRWAKWKPWALAGFGGAVAAAGVPLILSARSKRDERRDFEQAECVGPDADCGNGSANKAHIVALDESADRRNLLANGAFIAGGALAATGLAMAIFNRPHQVRRPADDVRASVWIDQDVVGATLFARF